MVFKLSVSLELSEVDVLFHLPLNAVSPFRGVG